MKHGFGRWIEPEDVAEHELSSLIEGNSDIKVYQFPYSTGILLIASDSIEEYDPERRTPFSLKPGGSVQELSYEDDIESYVMEKGLAKDFDSFYGWYIIVGEI